MHKLLTGKRTPNLVISDKAPDRLTGQILAVGVSAALLATAWVGRPILDLSAYLICAPGLLLCGLFGGWRATASATVLTVIGGLVIEGLTQGPAVERWGSAALYGLLGVGLAALIHHLGPGRPVSRLESSEIRDDTIDLPARVWRPDALDERVSALSHELNQPLSAMTNYLRAARNHIARLELDDDDLLDAVVRAGDQSVRAGEIIRAMRDLATGRGAGLKPERLSAIIGEVEGIVSLMAREADVRIFCDLYTGDDTVMADRIQIQQLLVNLVRNAIEAVSKHPHRQVNISTLPDADGQLVTTVEDSGPGIDPSVAVRLFQPMARTNPKGMGLGLSISSAIVENHRGRIWVEPSRLGGAAFCFVLAQAGSNGDVSD